MPEFNLLLLCSPFLGVKGHKGEPGKDGRHGKPGQRGHTGDEGERGEKGARGKEWKIKSKKYLEARRPFYSPSLWWSHQPNYQFFVVRVQPEERMVWWSNPSLVSSVGSHMGVFAWEAHYLLHVWDEASAGFSTSRIQSCFSSPVGGGALHALLAHHLEEILIVRGANFP